ncbi:hypothetical protein B0T09DRAFT_51690 [Sordaria sp. MPI-SDFR-AT-0083]|nr:hypothetical protein B0T09DRAFT_51690 [Sordaria sp. MPI-SDFR-AT-0083]
MRTRGTWMATMLMMMGSFIAFICADFMADLVTHIGQGGLIGLRIRRQAIQLDWIGGYRTIRRRNTYYSSLPCYCFAVSLFSTGFSPPIADFMERRFPKHLILGPMSFLIFVSYCVYLLVSFFLSFLSL